MKNLILRNTPAVADSFILRDIEKKDGKNTWEIYCEDGKIVIAGDCKISQAMGYYAYLKKYCRVNLSHCGNTQLNVTQAPLFEGKEEKVIPQEKRVYLNYCTFGYSAAFWKWEKWEKEIDFMAMNGINMPLSIVGSEAVWFYALRKMKYSVKGALEYLSGPAFWPWQLMTNIDRYFTLTDEEYIRSRVELGKKIIDREIELGMTPIQQGFSGVVPGNLRKAPDFAGTRMTINSSWCNFPVTYQLDPTDTSFRKFGNILLETQKELFGAYHYYACDPFHENKPPLKSKDYLYKVGRAIDTLYKEFDPDSVWVMQSWSLRDQIVSAVPAGRLLILDIDGTKHSEHNEFQGHDFVLGRIHSFGDRNTLHGSIKEVADNAYASLNVPNCVGTGLFPEGIFQNPLYYDLSFEMLTEKEPVALDKWLDDYAERRYGSKEECLKEAVRLMYKSCYSENCTGRETGSVIAFRPSTVRSHTAPNDHPELRYDNRDLLAALEKLLEAENASSDGYAFDVCDLTRQVLSNYCSVLYDRTMQGFNERNVNLFERSSNAFLKICEELDSLLLTRPELTLSEHLKEAGDLALNEKDKENYELNLLTQITVWGPFRNTTLYDYAWKEWGGLIGTYYVKRWNTFFERLAIEFVHKRRKFTTVTKKQHDGRNEYAGNEFCKSFATWERDWLSKVDPPKPVEADTVAAARELVEKYSAKIKEG